MFNILSKAVSSLASDIFFFILASLLTIYIYIYIYIERERERERERIGIRGRKWKSECGTRK